MHKLLLVLLLDDSTKLTQKVLAEELNGRQKSLYDCLLLVIIDWALADRPRYHDVAHYVGS